MSEELTEKQAGMKTHINQLRDYAEAREKKLSNFSSFFEENIQRKKKN